MLINESFSGYHVLKEPTLQSFEESFVYTQGSLKITHNHLESVLHISKYVDDYFLDTLVSGLDMSLESDKEKLLVLMKDYDEFKKLVSSGEIKNHFKLDKDFVLKSYIDNLSNEEKETLLYLMLKKQESR